jgi:hypothetical protein
MAGKSFDDAGPQNNTANKLFKPWRRIQEKDISISIYPAPQDPTFSPSCICQSGETPQNRRTVV